MNRKNLEELRRWATENNLERYRADQIYQWVYKKWEDNPWNMTNLSKELRKWLSENFKFHTLEKIEKVEAPDSVKYLFKTEDGHLVETVLIREKDHWTLCVSTQIGCNIGCKFCATAKDGLIRNLTTAEILDQLLWVQKDIKDLPKPWNKVRNIVFMGMGEPLANFTNLKKAVEIFIDQRGIDISKRRLTISSSGILYQLRKMAQDPVLRSVNLAISLNAPNQEIREEIMPIARSNPFDELWELLVNYPLPEGRKITLEYVLIKDINDSEECAYQLAKLVKPHRKRFKVNLIPFNPSPILPYERPEEERIFKFQKILLNHSIIATIRWSKGQKVFGACGQLRAKREIPLIG
ncbi:MAG: 23S rRNA (adenine(2503)-C(2))-methyltransferase RlmN [Gammaproteobacteria bacterium]|nr:MAG: 23S rRNA (adenine(2503)-C(2))-methyltransferase RlmN [Gammaproteobacteria bacterium]